MSNLLAYIPTLNQRHLDWFSRHPRSNLFLISQEEAEELLPRLSRNMAALPTEVVATMISSLGVVKDVWIFSDVWWREYILPDEDISHLFAEKRLAPKDCKISFEMIWARYDMTAVTREQPIIADVEVSQSASHLVLMGKALEISERSPDWWRRIGALAATPEGVVLAAAYNTHMPNEYETYIFGDPGLNRDAGQAGKYTSIHAEEAVITHCSRCKGVGLEGAHMFVTTFPCEGCARQIGLAGVSKLFFKDGYSVLNAQDVLRSRGVQIIRVISPESV